MQLGPPLHFMHIGAAIHLKKEKKVSKHWHKMNTFMCFDVTLAIWLS